MRISIVIDSRIRVPCDHLTRAFQEELVAGFTHANPKKVALEYMGIPAWKEPRFFENWDLCQPGPLSAQGPAWLHRARERLRNADVQGCWLAFPRGGLARVRDLLTREGLEWSYDDRRCLGSDALLKKYGPYPDSSIELRSYQREAIDVMHAKQNALIRGSTGVGKTEIILGLIAKVARPALVIVWSAALFEQWVERVKRTFGLTDKAIGRLRGSKRRLGLITVAMQQTLASMNNSELAVISGEFGLVAADEVQRFAAPSLFRVLDEWPAKWRVGVSANEVRKDGLQFLVHDLIGTVVHEVSREEMIEGGHVLEVEVRVLPTEFRADWYGLDETGEGDRQVDFNRLLDEMKADEARNLLAIECAAREAIAGKPTIVMTHRRDHAFLLEAEISARGVRTGLAIGGDDYAVTFRDTLARFRKGKLLCAVGTVQAVGTGLDLPIAQVGVATTPLASNRALLGQVEGRFCRNAKGKTSAMLYYLWDQHVYPRHIGNLVAWCSRVVVWDGTRWIPGREYARAMRGI